MPSRNPLIPAAELLDLLSAPAATGALRLVDARFELSDPAYGKAAFARGTLPGAVHLDLDEDLSSPAGEVGGRHPLPDMAELAAKLGALGIGERDTVVVFDDAGAMYAARAWWLLRYAGMRDVRFLDGGMAAYLAAGGELAAPAEAHAPVGFVLDVQTDMVVDHEFVAGIDPDDDVLLLDARAPERYRGDVEPLDPKAGHVPGAVNRFFQANMAGGRFASREVLRSTLAPAAGKGTVVAYCGSGVSAAHLIIGLEVAGYHGAKLYVGSWSDWSQRDLPVATGDEER